MRQFNNGKQWQKLSSSDLLRDGVAVFTSVGETDIIYSDPPWNPGNEKYWRNLAHKEPPKSYLDFLNAWCKCVIISNPRHVLVEQSIIESHRSLLLKAIENTNGWKWKLQSTYVVMYGSPERPNVLLHFGPSPLKTNPTGLKGDKMTRIALSGLPLKRGMVIADPCTGLGRTSRIAHELGLNFFGVELSEQRLERTIEWITKKGYVET